MRPIIIYIEILFKNNLHLMGYEWIIIELLKDIFEVLKANKHNVRILRLKFCRSFIRIEIIIIVINLLFLITWKINLYMGIDVNQNS